ncbi:MAG: hypothetical protein LKJ44_06635 [Bifidobacteriaceae bacterium]|nr:hypothetical protein [Bifidobacteriaceae bacterium]
MVKKPPFDVTDFCDADSQLSKIASGNLSSEGTTVIRTNILRPYPDASGKKLFTDPRNGEEVREDGKLHTSP